MKPIYLDNAATTRVYPEILNELAEIAGDAFGNPSSVHSEGRKARKLIEDSRRNVSEILGCKPSEVFFTSGGSESDTWALYGAAHAPGNKKRTLITSCIEHKAILSCAAQLEKEGYKVIYLPVDADGIVSKKALLDSLTDDVFLVSVMTANNETGVIQDIEALADIAHSRRALFHTDAVQGVIDTEYDLEGSNIDMLSISAHKLHALKGCGALAVKHGVNLCPMVYGGAQEQGKRAGTENLIGIYSLGRAAQIIKRDRLDIISGRQLLTARLETALLERIDGIKINSAASKRVSGISNISFPGVDGEALMLNLDLNGVCASTGSACLSGSVEPSHVLLAMGVPKRIAVGSVRFSVSDDNTEAEIDAATDIITETVRKLRRISNY